VRVPWLIVGGGIHGVHIAACLRAQAGLAAEDLLIVDHEDLLAVWRRQTAAVGMRHLRSPAVHHLDPEPFDLLHFSESRDELGGFRPPYARPALALFEAHCEEVLTRYDLRTRHLRSRVAGLEPQAAGVQVLLESGLTLEAERVVLALGQSQQTAWPDWARGLQAQAPSQVVHAFDPGVAPAAWAHWERIVVLGAGISGAQIGLSLARQGREVLLISRHPLREHQFDSDPQWLGPKGMEGFRKATTWEARRRIIHGARHRGSVPGDVRRALRAAIRCGRLGWRLGEVRAAACQEGELRLDLGSETLRADGLILATGFTPGHPALVERLVAELGLPVAPCGAPVVGPDLRWQERIFVSGALAELELGPVAKNISGARRAAGVITRAVCGIARAWTPSQPASTHG
jgi:thioredoxin reductase